jgi:hypothetical protein
LLRKFRNNVTEIGDLDGVGEVRHLPGERFRLPGTDLTRRRSQRVGEDGREINSQGAAVFGKEVVAGIVQGCIDDQQSGGCRRNRRGLQRQMNHAGSASRQRRQGPLHYVTDQLATAIGRNKAGARRHRRAQLHT